MASSPAALFEAGQSAYRQSEWAKAHDLFSLALKATSIGHHDRLKLLDHRVGTLLKLSRREEAMKDAKAMIREARHDGRGYLRCGQLESLAENYRSALKWYEHGLKNVPSSDRLRSTLQVKAVKTLDLAQHKIVRENARDPMATLPLEIIEMIIERLDFRTLVRLTRVSKPWRDILGRLPPLSDTIDFSAASRNISYPQFQAALRRLKKYPRKAVLTSLIDSASKLLPDHLERWLQKDCLEHLEVDDKRFAVALPSISAPRLKSLVVGEATMITSHYIGALLIRCTQLVQAKFANVSDATVAVQLLRWPAGFSQSSLLHLEMRSVTQGPQRSTFAISNFMPFHNLETLRCSGVHLTSPLEDQALTKSSQREPEPEFATLPIKQLEFSRCIILYPPPFPSAITELDISNTEYGCEQHEESSQLPQLKHLNLFGTRNNGTTAGLLAASSTNGCLHTLHLDLGYFEWSSEWLYQLDGQFTPCLNHQSLKHLRLRSQNLGDEDAETFMNRFPKLETLRVEVAAISGVFIAALLRQADRKLKYICLQDCANVSRDAVDFARSLGVNVEVKTTYTDRGGRQIVQKL